MAIHSPLDKPNGIYSGLARIEFFNSPFQIRGPEGNGIPLVIGKRGGGGPGTLPWKNVGNSYEDGDFSSTSDITCCQKSKHKMNYIFVFRITF